MDSMHSCQNFNDIFHQVKINPKICMELQRMTNKQSNLKQICRHLLDFKIYSKAIVIKTAWSWHDSRYRSMKQNWEHKSKSTRQDSLIVERFPGHTMKSSRFNNWCLITHRRMKSDSHLTPQPKINSNKSTFGSLKHMGKFSWHCPGKWFFFYYYENKIRANKIKKYNQIKKRIISN